MAAERPPECRLPSRDVQSYDDQSRQSSTLTASVVNSSNTGVTWSIASPAGFGTLSSTTANPVTYTAPTSVSKTTLVTIMATAAASSSVTATAQITVQSSAGTIALSPGAPQTINVAEALPITASSEQHRLDLGELGELKLISLR